MPFPPSLCRVFRRLLCRFFPVFLFGGTSGIPGAEFVEGLSGEFDAGIDFHGAFKMFPGALGVTEHFLAHAEIGEVNGGAFVEGDNASEGIAGLLVFLLFEAGHAEVAEVLFHAGAEIRGHLEQGFCFFPFLGQHSGITGVEGRQSAAVVFRLPVDGLDEEVAGFIVALTGEIMTMPGLPKRPAAERIDVDETGKISGLF